MGTSTIFKRFNDIQTSLARMTKKQLAALDDASPWTKAENLPSGWSVPFELHNGNVYVLVWWQGRLMKLEDAPEQLSEKYYNKYKGKTLNVYEWTLLRKYCQRCLEQCDEEFNHFLVRNPHT